VNAHPICQIPGRFRKRGLYSQMKVVPELALIGQYHLTAQLEQNHQQHQAHEQAPAFCAPPVKLIVGIFHIW
jgi:hypothetical protein